MIYQQILAALGPSKRRLRVQRLMRYLPWSAIVGSTAALVLTIYGKWQPVTFLGNKIIAIMGLAWVLGSLVALLKPIRWQHVAMTVDALGLDERLTTALQLEDDLSVVAELQKADALQALQIKSYHKDIRLHPGKKSVMYAFASVLAVLILIALPTQAMAEAEALEVTIEKMAESIEKIEKIEEEVEKASSLNDVEKTEVKEALKPLKEAMQKPQDFENINKELLKAEKKLNNIKRKASNRKMKDLGDQLDQVKAFKNIAESVRSRDAESLAKDIEKMKADLEAMSQTDKEEIAKAVNDLTKEMAENPDLKAALEQLAENLEAKTGEDSSGKLGESLNDLNESLNQVMASDLSENAVGQLSGELSEISEMVDENCNHESTGST